LSATIKINIFYSIVKLCFQCIQGLLSTFDYRNACFQNSTGFFRIFFYHSYIWYCYFIFIYFILLVLYLSTHII